MGFREMLPTGCPPPNARDGAFEVAFRLVSTVNPDVSAFESHAAKQEPLPPGVTPCRWASCSLFVDLETVAKKRNAFKKLIYGFCSCFLAGRSGIYLT